MKRNTVKRFFAQMPSMIRSNYVVITATLIAINANAIQYWRGTDGNSVWDTQTANWAATATTNALRAFKSCCAAV